MKIAAQISDLIVAFNNGLVFNVTGNCNSSQTTAGDISLPIAIHKTILMYRLTKLNIIVRGGNIGKVVSAAAESSVKTQNLPQKGFCCFNRVYYSVFVKC